MKIKNYTPHTIHMNEGTSYESEGVARVSATFTDFNENGICSQKFGEVENLPEPEEGVIYIVSSMVLSAIKDKRSDVVAPATGHPHCIRDENGRIKSVPGFVR